MRLILSAMALLLVAGCAPSMHISERNHSHTLENLARKATVCEIANWGRDMVGVRVRIRGEYFTDLRHGAFLSDHRCPTDRLQLAADAPDANNSVSNFNKATAEHGRYYIGHKFKVDVTGIFEWSKGRIINKDLPSGRQYRIPPHGMLSLLKVWNFDKPEAQ